MNKDGKAFLILIALTIIIVFKTLRLSTGQQIKQGFRRLPDAFKYRDEFKLRAPKDRLYNISYVLLTFAGIFLVHTEERNGIVKGDEQDRSWVEKNLFRKKEFDNPVVFSQNLVPLFREITNKVKPNIPIYAVVVFNNRTNIENAHSSSIPILKAQDFYRHVLSYEEKVLEQSDINVLHDELTDYRFNR